MLNKLNISEYDYDDENRSMSSISSSTTTTTSSMDNEDDDIKCNDPFWDYYITISKISRANIFELINVMKHISAQHITKLFIQEWLQNKIKPKLPFIYSKISSENNNNNNSNNIQLKPLNINTKSFTMSKYGVYKFNQQKHEGLHMHTNTNYTINSNTNYTVHSNQLTKFIQKSLKNKHTKHPNYFNIPYFNNFKYIKNIKFNINNIGINILSFLDQNTFISASHVSRSWFYCSRYSKSKTHIKLKLLNILKYFSKYKYLLNVIMTNNNIICLNDTDNNDNEIDDILLKIDNDNNTDNKTDYIDDIFRNFSSFFMPRKQLFSKICLLQIDLNILINNCLIYFIDDKLYDNYWQIIFILFNIKSLESIDLILIDPHILLLSYIIKNIKYNNKFYINIKQLKFPSIGFPSFKGNKNGNKLYNSKHIKSLCLKCKSLSTNQLIKILNTHFKTFYHNNHHNDDNNIKKHYKYYKYFKSLDSYILCRKIIQKPLIFDITHALDSNNLNNIESLIIYDTRCSKKEFETFLLKNSKTLKNLEIIFSELCLLPNYNAKSNYKSKSKRIINYLNDILNGIIKYLNNNTIRINLNSFALSFPESFIESFPPSNMLSFINLFKIFEKKYNKIKINKLYLNGPCLTINKINWEKIFKFQYIKSLHLQKLIYSDLFFDYFTKLWSNCLVNLELTISFEKSNYYSFSENKLFLYLSKCYKLKYLSLNLIQKSSYKSSFKSSYKTNYNYLFQPIFDICDLNNFIISHSKLKSLKLLFNEISTQKFERNKSIKKFESYGEILRISNKFKMQIEQLIMSWFCNTNLNEITMIRKLSSFNNNKLIFNDKNNDNCHYNFNISCFNTNNIYNMNDLILFQIKKWKIGNLYKGEVTGDIDQLLMPEIPII